MPTSLSLLSKDQYPLQEIARLYQPPEEKDSYVRPAPYSTHPKNSDNACLHGKAGPETMATLTPNPSLGHSQPPKVVGQSWVCLTKHILDKLTEIAPSHEKPVRKRAKWNAQSSKAYLTKLLGASL